jgi:hypothetical protein
MAESTQSDASALAESFWGHLIAFHQTLPPEERALIERVWELAGSASGTGGDVQGFGTGPVSALTLVLSPIDPRSTAEKVKAGWD